MFTNVFFSVNKISKGECLVHLFDYANVLPEVNTDLKNVDRRLK